MRLLSLIVAAVVGVATAPPMSGHVMVANAWFRALPANLPAGGYFELRNVGRWPAILTGAASPACGMLMLHKSELRNGVERMSDAGTIDIPAGGALKFAPGGDHLMCTSPTPAMKPGTSVLVTLSFSDGSVATETFAVKNAKGE
jgi:periplasmic copper chaperone A